MSRTWHEQRHLLQVAYQVWWNGRFNDDPFNLGKSELTLRMRQWQCPSCKVVHARDYNASINIHREGLRIYAQSQEPLESRELAQSICITSGGVQRTPLSLCIT